MPKPPEPSQHPQPTGRALSDPTRRRGLLGLLAVLVLLAIVAAASKLLPDSSADQPTALQYTVRPETITIQVTESGSIKARDPVEIKSQVEGSQTIISLVPEGTVITPDDVANGKVLVELDSSDIRRRLTERETSYQQSLADFTEAQENYRIQLKQNESDIQTAQLEVHFKWMDFERYTGEQLANEITKQMDPNAYIDRNLADIVGDFENLGGEALQRYRDLSTQIDLAVEELKQAQSRLSWTEKLYEKEYVPRTEYEADALTVKRREIEVEKARLNLQLFEQYELGKELKQRYSDYLETQRELDRTIAKARSQLSQKAARLDSRKARLMLGKEELDNIRRQLEACTIRAPAPGMVVYEKMGRWDREVIEVGTSVRERQRIMTIPNTSEMAVDVKVHESWMARIRPGQKAEIVVEAFPDQVLTGEVLKIAPLPDNQRWLNPDLKVYSTEVSVHGSHEFLKSGMSSKVTIIIETLNDVLTIPVYALHVDRGQRYCFVSSPHGPKRQPVTTGPFTEDHIVVTDGLEPGDVVLLAAKASAGTTEQDRDTENAENTDNPGNTNNRSPRSGNAGNRTSSQHQRRSRR